MSSNWVKPKVSLKGPSSEGSPGLSPKLTKKAIE